MSAWSEPEPPDLEAVPTLVTVGAFLGGVVLAAAGLVWAVRRFRWVDA